MSHVKWARRAVGIAVAVAVLLPVGGGSATISSIPTIYVSYTGCQFTMSSDSVASITSGTSIDYGTYQIEVTTPNSYSGDPTTCNNQSISHVNFQLTGPGVSQTTTVGDGDGQSVTLTSVALPANSNFTATDTTFSPALTTITFSTNNTAVQSSSSVATTTTSTSSSGGCSVLGASSGCSTTGTGSTIPSRGSLAGIVSSAGKLKLSFKGKAVTTLLAGDYSLTVSDRSHKAAFILKGAGHPADTITTAAFLGKSKTVTVHLTTGQWYFAPKSGAPKTYEYFYVES